MGQRAAGCNRAHPGIEGGKKPESGSGMDLGSQPVVKAGSNPQRSEARAIQAYWWIRPAPSGDERWSGSPGAGEPFQNHDLPDLILRPSPISLSALGRNGVRASPSLAIAPIRDNLDVFLPLKHPSKPFLEMRKGSPDDDVQQSTPTAFFTPKSSGEDPQ